MKIGRCVQFPLSGHKDVQITEGTTPFGNQELTMSQGYGGICFRSSDIPEIIRALQVFNEPD